MNKGDILWCTSPVFGNKPNRPCVVLEVLEDDKLKVLINH